MPSAPETAAVERLFETAARIVRPLAAATPENLLAERERLAAAIARGARAMPRWRYAAPSEELARLRPLLEHVATGLPGREPYAIVLRERAAELAIEAALGEAVGTAGFAELARARYAAEGDDPGLPFAHEVLARRAPPPRAEGAEETLASTDPSRESLVSRMRAELGKRKLPFAVRTTSRLSALAATGESYVLVAEGRATTRADVERTVVHEIEGHVVPRVRARAQQKPIFRLGSAKGTDDQEGYALLVEERHRHLDHGRLRELSLRRVAVDLAERGATYHDAAHALVASHGTSPEDAARITERAFRGGTGHGAGLVRDRPYLGAYLAMKTAFAEREGPVLEDLVSRGQISLRAARLLAALEPPR